MNKELWDLSEKKIKKTAIICDVDGTVALMNGRGPFDWD